MKKVKNLNAFRRMGKTNRTACVSLHRVAAEFIENGCIAYFPSTGASPIDLVVQKDEKLFRVEIKTTNFMTKYGSYCVTLSNNHCNTKEKIRRNSNNGDWDILAVDLPQINTICYLLSKEVPNLSSLQLSLYKSENWRGKHKRRLISDYSDIGRVLEKKT